MSNSDSELTWFEPNSPVLLAWKRAMDSMLQGELSLARAAFTENAVWYDTFVGTVRGSEAIAEQLSAAKGRDFDTSTIEVVSALSDEDTGAIEWIQTIRTGNRTARLEGSSWVSVVDGRLSRLWDYIQPLKNRKP